MLETENKIKSDKRILAKLREENTNLQKLHDKAEKMRFESEEAQMMNDDLQQMRDSAAEMSRKQRKI